MDDEKNLSSEESTEQSKEQEQKAEPKDGQEESLEESEDSAGEGAPLEDQMVEVSLRKWEEVQKKAEESEKNLSYAQRAVAELENYRMRVQKEKEMALLMTTKNIMMDLLPIVDNVERAISAADTAKKIEDLMEGFKIIESEIAKFFASRGMKPIEALEQPFDPHYHEAMGELEKEGTEEGMVVYEIRKGYTWRDVVLRPSQVMVAKKSQGEKPGEKTEIENPETRKSSEEEPKINPESKEEK